MFKTHWDLPSGLNKAFNKKSILVSAVPILIESLVWVCAFFFIMCVHMYMQIVYMCTSAHVLCIQVEERGQPQVLVLVFHLVLDKVSCLLPHVPSKLSYGLLIHWSPTPISLQEHWDHRGTLPRPALYKFWKSELRYSCFHDKCLTDGAFPNIQDQCFHSNSLMINLILLSLHCRDINLQVGVHGVDRQKHMRVHLVSPIDFALMFKEIDLVEFL